MITETVEEMDGLDRSVSTILTCQMTTWATWMQVIHISNMRMMVTMGFRCIRHRETGAHRTPEDNKANHHGATRTKKTMDFQGSMGPTI